MSKTVKEHFDECKEVAQVIDNANALLTKTRAELDRARSVLERLIEYQHPKMTMSINYVFRDLVGEGAEKSGCDPATLIRAEVAAINKLLGDRA